MLKIRLQRVGRRNDPSFRVVVTESTRGPRNNRYIEMLGAYNPKQSSVSIQAERVKHWLGVGAQVSDTVYNILIDQKVVEGKKRNALPKKRPIVKETDQKENVAIPTPVVKEKPTEEASASTASAEGASDTETKE